MRVCLALVALQLGCSSSEFTVGAPDDASTTVDEGVPADAASEAGDARLTLEQACDRSAENVCAKFEACNPITFRTAWGSADFCRARIAIGCRRGLSMPGVRITPEEQLACNQAAVSLECAAFINGAPPCAYTAGALAVGDRCVTDLQCGSRFCRLASGTLCGTCAVPPGDGEACVDRCATSALVCINSVCKKRGTGGQPCDPTTAPCVPSLVCSGGRCVEPAGRGEKCDATGATAPQCNVYSGLYCNAGACTPFEYAAPGAPCASVSASYTLCTVSSFCRVPTGSISGTCIPHALEGAACNTTTGPGCIPGSACIGGTCRIADPAACE